MHIATSESMFNTLLRPQLPQFFGRWLDFRGIESRLPLERRECTFIR